MSRLWPGRRFAAARILRQRRPAARRRSAAAPCAAIESLEDRTLLSGGSIWISAAEIARLPTSGDAWNELLDASQQDTGTPNLSDQNDNTDVYVLAKALVGVRLGDESLQVEARTAILAAMGTEDGGRTLALGRNLAAYVIAADLVGLDAAQDTAFRSWLAGVLDEDLQGRTLNSTHEDRANNWGTAAGGSRAAAAAYLGDQELLDRTAQVLEGWLGNRNVYAGFGFGSDLSWQADPDSPVGINPLGSMKEGVNVDGALPEEMRRGGSFQQPPLETGYPWGGMQGAVVQAEILQRAGYDAWQWEDQALLRATSYLTMRSAGSLRATTPGFRGSSMPTTAPISPPRRTPAPARSSAGPPGPTPQVKEKSRTTRPTSTPASTRSESLTKSSSSAAACSMTACQSIPAASFPTGASSAVPAMAASQTSAPSTPPCSSIRREPTSCG